MKMKSKKQKPESDGDKPVRISREVKSLVQAYRQARAEISYENIYRGDGVECLYESEVQALALVVAKRKTGGAK